MKILCEVNQDDSHIYRGWKRVLEACGHQFIEWNQPIFDAFDEHQPELFIQTSPLSFAPAVDRCLKDHPNVKSIYATDPEPGVDTFIGDGISEHLKCDFSYVGNYREDKRGLLDAYISKILPLGNVKIFGNEPWGGSYQYLGPLSEADMGKLFASSTISLNISQVHEKGKYIWATARTYQIPFNNGFCLSNKMTDGVFPKDTIPQAKNSGEFALMAQTFLKNPGEMKKIAARGRDFVLRKHTYWHRLSNLFGEWDMGGEAKRIMGVFNAAF